MLLLYAVLVVAVSGASETSHSNMASFRPVVFMHGFALDRNQGSPHDWDAMRAWICELHPGTKTFAVPLFAGLDSTRPMTEQLPAIAAYIANLTSSFDSWIGVGHSQGGLLMRCVAESVPNSRMHKLISLAGVQNGYYGLPLAISVLGKVLPLDAATDILYSKPLQDELSVANWWRSPDAQFYASKNLFLPLVNNEKSPQASFRQNFLATGSVHLFGSPDDGTVVPWQTELFGQYADGDNPRNPTTLIAMRHTNLYKNDTFGLKTMDSEGRLFLHAVAGVEHAHWLSNKTNFLANILPLLD